MNKRLRSRVLAASMVSTTLLGSGGLLSNANLFAQEKPSAADLLDRGAKLYEQKQYSEAKKILVDIDPAQLPEDQRAKCAELIKDTDMELAKAAGSNAAFDAAQSEMDGGKLSAAAIGFQAIIDDASAPADVKDKAKIQLALVKDMQAAKAPQMTALLNEAEELFKAGKLDEAQNALTTIQATGSDLGWQDRERPAQLQAKIDAARVAAKNEGGTSATVTPPAPIAPVADTTGTPATAVENVPPAAPQAAVETPAVPAAEAAPAVSAAPEAPAAPAAPAIDPNSLLGQVELKDRVERDRALTLYHQDLDQSDAALLNNPPGYSAAIGKAQDAVAVIDDNRRYFSEIEASALRDAAQQRLQRATNEKHAFDVAESNVATETAAVEAKKRAERIKAERERRVSDLMHQANVFTEHQQYREAADTLRNVLVIDPTNNSAKLALQLVTDRINYREWERLTKERSKETVRQSIDNMEHLVPYTDLLVYPNEWVELTRTRVGDQSNADTPQNRAVRERLEENLKEISAEQQGFEKVITFLRDNTNTNIFVNWNTLQAAGIDRNTPVSVNLREVSFRKALVTILSEVGGGSANLAYTIDDGVITISTREDLNSARYQVVRVFDVRDMLVQPDNNINPPQFSLSDITKSGSSSGGSGGGGAGTGSLFSDTTGAGGAAPKSRDEIVKDIIDTIKTTVAPETWRDAGGQIGSIRELNGQLIINQTLDHQSEVYNLLQQLRETRALQITIEARIMLVTNNFFDQLGFDWNLNLSGLGSIVQAPGVTIKQNTTAAATPPSTGVTGTLAGLGAGTGMNATATFGSILDNFTLGVLLQATQADQRTITVDAPRVTLFNGQKGYIAVTDQQNFVSNFNQTVTSGGLNSNGVVGTNLTVSTLTTGIVLLVEATVSADRRYVVMKVKPQLSHLVGIQTFDLTGRNPNGNDVFATVGFVQLPEVQYTTVDTMVSVPDGGTLLLGGEKIVGESEIEIGVPVLSKIPFISRLFTNKSMAKDERTLIILVRPKIIIQREIENNLFGQGYDRPTGLPNPTAGSGLNGNGVAPGFSVGGASR